MAFYNREQAFKFVKPAMLFCASIFLTACNNEKVSVDNQNLFRSIHTHTHTESGTVPVLRTGFDRKELGLIGDKAIVGEKLKFNWDDSIFDIEPFNRQKYHKKTDFWRDFWVKNESDKYITQEMIENYQVVGKEDIPRGGRKGVSPHFTAQGTILRKKRGQSPFYGTRHHFVPSLTRTAWPRPDHHGRNARPATAVISSQDHSRTHERLTPSRTRRRGRA